LTKLSKLDKELTFLEVELSKSKFSIDKNSSEKKIKPLFPPKASEDIKREEFKKSRMKSFDADRIKPLVFQKSFNDKKESQTPLANRDELQLSAKFGKDSLSSNSGMGQRNAYSKGSYRTKNKHKKVGKRKKTMLKMKDGEIYGRERRNSQICDALIYSKTSELPSVPICNEKKKSAKVRKVTSI
jgi:Ulp1 family protease